MPAFRLTRRRYSGNRIEKAALSWALRFAQSLDQVDVALSGMNTMEQMLDNMRDMQPLTPEEMEAVKKVRMILEKQIAVACTGCRYCMEECPEKIAIPDYFQLYNEHCRHQEEDWKAQPVYDSLSKMNGRASSCVGCRRCEEHCPQHLEISRHLRDVAGIFEKNY